MFGDQLRALRSARGLALVDVATRAQMSASYLSRVERGLRGIPGIATLERLAEALDVPISELLAMAGARSWYAHETENLYGLPISVRTALYDAIGLFNTDDWEDLRALIGSKLSRHRKTPSADPHTSEA